MLLALALSSGARADLSPDGLLTTDVIVGLEPDASLTLTLLQLDGLLVDEMPDANVYLVSVPSLPLTLPVGVSYLEPDESVALPQALRVGVLGASSSTTADWYLEQPSLAHVNASGARAYSTGAGVVVADIDARFDTNHPALVGHLGPGYDFVGGGDSNAGGLTQSSASFMFQYASPFLDQSSASFMFESGQGFLDQSSASFMFQQYGVAPLTDSVVTLLDLPGVGYSHGTFTAGLIAVTAPDATIMPIRAFDDQGHTDVFTLAKAVRFATKQGADVINMSWGLATDATTLRNAIRYAADHGVVLVAAAGNSNDETLFYPAAYPDVIAVAATDESDRKAAFSTYGPQILVDAPGVNIISAYPGDRYAVESGTSFSAPIVAGEAALIRAEVTGGVSDRVGASAIGIDENNPDYAGELGRGRIDMVRGVGQ